MLIRVEDLAFILCWADEAGGAIGFDLKKAAVTAVPGNISEIELPRLGLRFKVRHNGPVEILVCTRNLQCNNILPKASNQTQIDVLLRSFERFPFI